MACLLITLGIAMAAASQLPAGGTWFGSPGESPRQMQSLPSLYGDFVLALPTVEGDSGTIRPVTILDPDGRIVFQDIEGSYYTGDEVYLAWDAADLAWVYADGTAAFYGPSGDGLQPWIRSSYGDPQRVSPDLPSPPPWLFPWSVELHRIPADIVSPGEGFALSDSGRGWELGFEYPPVPAGLEFLRTEVMDDMRIAEALFAAQAEREFDQYGSEEGWVGWFYDGRMSILPAPEGMATASVDYYLYTGGIHGTDNLLLYRYATSPGPDGSVTWSPIGTRDILADSVELAALSAIVTDSLAERLGPDADMDWIIQGAGPEWGNYDQLIPVPDPSGALAGFRVVFPSYCVAAFAYGPQEVFVPIGLLRQ